LHLALETAQRVFQRLTFLNADFSHCGIHHPSDACGKYCCISMCYERVHSNRLLAPLLTEPSSEVKLCFSDILRRKASTRPLTRLAEL
jgi:hypothetical protein